VPPWRWSRPSTASAGRRSWPQFSEYGTPLVDDPARLDGVRRLGVDETAFLAANALRSTRFVTGVVDLTGRAARPRHRRRAHRESLV